ncbi:hypothetical protein D210916BOD24_16250 [Alteromonas sp. D210916BOD_24]
MRLLGIVFTVLLTGTTASYAAQRVVTNEARIEVENQSQATQREALKKALRQVFVKMSGSTAVLDNPGVRAALSTPQSLLRSYRFDYDNGTTYYIADFDQVKLTDLLQREMLPLWGDRRPETIVWLAQESADRSRFLLDESQPSSLADALRQTAVERGLPLSLPLMDLTDNTSISTYDVWGRFVEPLRKASIRYGIDNIIGARVYRNDPTAIPEFSDNPVASGTIESLDDVIGNDSDISQSYAKDTQAQRPDADSSHFDSMANDVVQVDGISSSEQPSSQTRDMDEMSHVESVQATSVVMPFTMDEFADHAKRADEGDYALDWVFIGGGKVSHGSIYADSPEAVATQLVDAYSNYLSSLYAVVGSHVSERETLTISVANIGTIESYASATAYLNSLSVIEDASLIQQSGTVATFALSLLGTKDDFLTSLRLETKLRTVTDAQGQSVQGYTFYWND